MSRHIPADFPKWYEDGFSNCDAHNLVSLLTDTNGTTMLRRLHRLVKDITGPQPSLIEYRTELQRTIEEDLRRGVLQEAIPRFKEKFTKMKDEKGIQMAVLHLACCVMKLLSNIGEAYPKKTVPKEEEEQIFF